jgi:hypothetical protein
MGNVLLRFNFSRPRRLIELSSATQMASRTLAENSHSFPAARWSHASHPPPQQWAAQILQLDQMGMLLSQIDWQKDNQPRVLSDENLPSLMDVLQMLP